MEELTLKDIFDACLEVPEGKTTPDIGITFTLGNEDQTHEAVFDGIFLRFIKSDDYFEIDFIFPNNRDLKLDGMLKFIKKWEESMMSEEPLALEIGIIPFKYRCKYSILAGNPILNALSSDSPKAYPHILKLVFDEEDVEVIESDAIDYDEMLADIKREIDKDNRRLRAEEEEKQRQEYEAFHEDLIGGE